MPALFLALAALQVVYFFRSCFYNAVVLILEYKCRGCLSVFESSGNVGSAVCVMCGGADVKRTDSMFFSPKKDFCPREHSDLLGKSESKCYHKRNKKP